MYLKQGVGINVAVPVVGTPDDGGFFDQQQSEFVGLSLNPLSFGGICTVQLTNASLAELGPGCVFVLDAGNVVIGAVPVQVVVEIPAVAGAEMNLANGAITDAKITLPAEPSAPATTALGMLQQLWRRFFKRCTRNATDIKTYKNDGTTVVTNQAYTSSGSAEDIGAAT